MNFTGIVFLCAILTISFAEVAKNCDVNQCKLPDCRCSTVQAPISGKLPQSHNARNKLNMSLAHIQASALLVSLSFDDSATELIYQDFYEKDLFHRKNPDGNPISGTFFVTHEYTDYQVVNKLYNHGFEIGSHSISKNFSTLYWNNATKQTIIDEMGGQRLILSKFANIPQAKIIGARIPHFQLNGDNTYLGLKEAGLVYDSSWPTASSTPLFPYTLNYLSTQQCYVGTCPTANVSGMWINPIIDWIGMDGNQCNKLLACDVNGTEEQILTWMKTNFERSYNKTKAPITLNLNYGWFNFVEHSRGALVKFLDHLSTLSDVFLVSQSQIINYMKNPVPVDKFSSANSVTATTCTPHNCKLYNDQQEEKYMGSCIECPKTYPSIDNPLGQ